MISTNIAVNYKCNGLKVGPNAGKCDEADPTKFMLRSSTRCRECHTRYQRYAYHASKIGKKVTEFDMFGDFHTLKAVVKPELESADDEADINPEPKDLKKVAKLEKENKALKLDNKLLENENERLEEEIKELRKAFKRVFAISEKAYWGVDDEE